MHHIPEIESESDFTSLIGTNILPTTEDAVRIAEYISKKVACVAAVEQEIEKLEALRAKLTLEIEEHRALISPIRHLPIDILQEIFTACLPATHNPVLSRHEAPLLLTRICGHWRNVMLSTPHLWSAIHIPIPSYPVNFNPHGPIGDPSDDSSALLTLIRERVAGIREWLDRSKGSPLSISVYDAGNVTDEVCNLVLDTIIPFSHRWKNLVVDTHYLDLTRIADLAPSKVPLLESFTVRNEAVIRNVEPPASPELISFRTLTWSTSEIIKAPKLRQITYPQVTENIVEFPLQWSQMTHIFFGSASGPRSFPTPTITLNQIAFLLRDCQQLVLLRLEVILLPGALDQNQSPICLPSLKVFSFHDSGVDVSSLFAILELPLLKFLEFNSNVRPLTQSALEMLLPRITTLEQLITEPQFFAQGQYAKCLSHMSSLTHISIRWSSFFRSPDWSPNFDDTANHYKAVSDDFLEWFTTPDPAGEYPVPSLEFFECHTTSEFTDAALVDFIKRKHSLPGIKALKRLFISVPRPQTADILGEIGEEISKDLDLELRYPYSPAMSLHGPVVFQPFAGIHLYPTPFLTGFGT